VDENAYYFEAVGIAKKLGITSGVDKINFNPRGEISRQDMMVLAAKALRSANKLPAEGSVDDLNSYSDASKISGYAADSVAALVKEGIINGSGNSINPARFATRAEAAALLYNIYKK
jgi:S-layer homology domain.